MRHFSLFIYNISVRAYFMAIGVAALWNKKAAMWVHGRRRWQEQIAAKKIGCRRVWFHCASLGEFEQTRPLIELWRQKHPADELVLSFFSPSGFEQVKNYSEVAMVFYLPPDTASNASRLIELLQPDVAVFCKYEFWYHTLTALKAGRIRTVLFSAVFRSSQPFFRWYGSLFRHMIGCFSDVFVQDENSQQLLQQIGVKSTVAGDTRFDRVRQLGMLPFDHRPLNIFCEGAKVLVAGSTWPQDEELLAKWCSDERSTGWKCLIAPHETGESRIAKLRARLGAGLVVTLSELELKTTVAAKVVVIDRMGLLSKLYSLGHVAYVGGGFGGGVHNVLEAAVYGLPVLMGPNHDKSLEACEMISCGMAVSVNDYQALSEALIHFSATDVRTRIGESVKQYVGSKTGATERVLASIAR